MNQTKVRKGKQDQAHVEVFELVPQQDNLKPFFKAVRVEFLQKKQTFKKYPNRPSKPQGGNWPVWNSDGLFYTPAFFIAEDQKIY